MTTLEQHLAAHQLGQRIDNNTLVCTCGDFVRDMPGTYDDPYREHRAHVAASWQEARTVRTVEEVEGLDMNALLLPLAPYSTVCDAGDFLDDYNSEFCDDEFPMLVIWTPEDGAL